MITSYISQQPVDDFGLRFADIKFSATLATSVDTPLTVPGDAARYKAIIKVTVTSEVWVSLNAVATVPAGASLARTNSELTNGVGALCREVRSGDVLHFITSSGTPEVSVVFYALNVIN